MESLALHALRYKLTNFLKMLVVVNHQVTWLQRCKELCFLNPRKDYPKQTLRLPISWEKGVSQLLFFILHSSYFSIFLFLSVSCTSCLSLCLCLSHYLLFCLSVSVVEEIQGAYLQFTSLLTDCFQMGVSSPGTSETFLFFFCYTMQLKKLHFNPHTKSF